MAEAPIFDLDPGMGYQFIYLSPDYKKRLLPRFYEIEGADRNEDFFALSQNEPIPQLEESFEEINQRVNLRIEKLRQMWNDLNEEYEGILKMVTESYSYDTFIERLMECRRNINTQKVAVDLLENSMRGMMQYPEEIENETMFFALLSTDVIFDNIFEFRVELLKIRVMYEVNDAIRFANQWNGAAPSNEYMITVPQRPTEFRLTVQSVAREFDKKIIACHQSRKGLLRKLTQVQQRLFPFRESEEGDAALKKINEIISSIRRHFGEIDIAIDKANRLNLDRMTLIDGLFQVMKTYTTMFWLFHDVVELDLQREDIQKKSLQAAHPMVASFQSLLRERKDQMERLKHTELPPTMSEKIPPSVVKVPLFADKGQGLPFVSPLRIGTEPTVVVKTVFGKANQVLPRGPLEQQQIKHLFPPSSNNGKR